VARGLWAGAWRRRGAQLLGVGVQRRFTEARMPPRRNEVRRDQAAPDGQVQRGTMQAEAYGRSTRGDEPRGREHGDKRPPFPLAIWQEFRLKIVGWKRSLLVAHSLADLLHRETAQRVKAGPSASGRHRVAHFGAASQITPGNLCLANGAIHSPGIVSHVMRLTELSRMVCHTPQATLTASEDSARRPVSERHAHLKSM
jgi:hypothetical protein